MRVLGIVAEFNPFHNGHKYLIDESKKLTGATHTVAVMSGDFVMRGEPACFNKLIRAEAAVRGGVDLVIELPLCFSLSSAEDFAFGGVSLLDSLNAVDFLSFGSECGDIGALFEIAGKLSEKDASQKIKTEMKDGIPVYEAIERLVPEHAEILKNPNNILGINYLKALIKSNSKIKPMTVKRKSAPHDSTEPDGEFASARFLRNRLENGEDISGWIPNGINYPDDHVSERSFDAAVTYSLRVTGKEEMKKAKDVSEGLENLISDAAKKNYGVDPIAMAIKSKRYTYTRIKRIIYNIFLGIDKDSCNSPLRYARVLAFNGRGRELLAALKEKSVIPLITNITEKTFTEYPEIAEEFKAAHIYSLGEKTGVSKGELICGYITD